ncbi:MAG: TonB family protein [Magnetococcales bacterium]|nr:TonB family protein [Magnetococcales bacterium]
MNAPDDTPNLAPEPEPVDQTMNAPDDTPNLAPEPEAELNPEPEPALPPPPRRFFRMALILSILLHLLMLARLEWLAPKPPEPKESIPHMPVRLVTMPPEKKPEAPPKAVETSAPEPPAPPPALQSPAPDPQPESKPESQPEPKPESQPEPKPEPKPALPPAPLPEEKRPEPPASWNVPSPQAERPKSRPRPKSQPPAPSTPAPPRTNPAPPEKSPAGPLNLNPSLGDMTRWDQDRNRKMREESFKSHEETVNLDTPKPRYTAYFARLKEQIQQGWVYPAQAKRDKLSGSLSMRFTIDKKGVVSDIRVINSSGEAILDEAALQAVRNISPFLPLPDDWQLEKLHVRTIFEYIRGGFHWKQ